ncbi:MAG: hypothetical protein WBA74_11710, partial [Cyclobacteriaceae bacterium]
PSTWVLTNRSGILGIKDKKNIEIPIHTSKPEAKITIYRLDTSICDKFYLFTIDGKSAEAALQSKLELRISELNAEGDPGVLKIELQSYLDHETTAHQVDKLTLLEIGIRD